MIPNRSPSQLCIVPGARRLWLATALLIASPPIVGAAEPLSRRWIYLQMNLQVADNVDRATEILRRGAKAGYNGVVLADYKLNILDRVPRHYFEHAKRFRAVADEVGMEIVPAVAPIGYSDGLLAHDPNLAEGIPVEGARFIVRDGTARLDSELKNALPGGGFETHGNNSAAGWDFQDAAGQSSFIDEMVRHSGKSSLRWDDPGQNARSTGGNARVAKLVRVSPWRQFHASVWIRTRGYEAAGSVRLFAMTTNGRVLSHANLGVKRDQDWTQHHIVFNSLDADQVRLYCGTWGGRGGTLWMDDVTLEETAFVNLLRREGCPLVVRDEKGTEFEEGKDFAPLSDPKLGTTPWAGSFDAWHEPPILKVAPKSRIREGNRLRIGFSHTVTVFDNQVTCCLGHPKVFTLVEDQGRRVNDLFAPKTYFLSHDEIRVANWCGSCRREGRTAGALLAENVRNCMQAVRKVSPDAQLCIWSDMFDPHHNAHDGFYLVNGNLAGSWDGLEKDVTVINWNSEKPAKSLPFFSGRGHRQVLAGYYDGDPKSIAGWLKAGSGLNRIDGVMYATWQNDFQHLEAFAAAAWGKSAR